MRNRSLKAFTLIEILVVISILALLAALLTPVFTTAKGRAKMATSLSNLRQLAAASTLYAQDHDDTYAFGIPGFWDNKRNYVPFDLRDNAKIAPIVEPLLAVYGASRDILLAPGDPGSSGGPTHFDLYGSSYSMRLRAFLQPRTLLSYEYPSRETLAHESGLYHDHGELGMKSRRCVVYQDGRAAYVTWERMIEFWDE